MQGWWISYRTYGRPIHSGAVAGPHIGYLRAAKAVLDDHDETPELLQQHPSVHLHWQTKHSECTLERMSTKKTKPLSNLLFGTKRGPRGGGGGGQAGRRLCTLPFCTLRNCGFFVCPEECFLLQEPVEVIDTMSPEEVRLSAARGEGKGVLLVPLSYHLQYFLSSNNLSNCHIRP